jgi:predicted Rdx family selenoprotein
MHTFKRDLASIVLIPGDDGVFEVRVGGELAFAKERPGHFPDLAQIVDTVYRARR